jgi:hypothetical protein
VLTSLSPSNAVAGTGTFTLTVTGSNFAAGALCLWNGSVVTTTVNSSNQLTATVQGTAIAAAGTAQVTVSVPVTGGNPLLSNALPFTINNPAPQISTLTPSSAQAGGAAFTLNVTGTGFVANSVVQWNGSARTTTFVSGTQLTAAISAADIAAAGNVNVTVVNPTPGGGTSAAVSFAITAANPVPGITSLAPQSATAGDAAFTLTVNGTGFLAASAVQWNGSNRTTTFVSNTQLTASIAASDVAAAGSASVTVVNPPPGGGTSNMLTFDINNPLPAVTSLSPSSASAGGAAFTLTVNGNAFVSGASVQWNGSNRTTTFVSNTQLTAAIPAADIAVAGTALVTVFNPAPGGGTSATILSFLVVVSNPVPVLTSLSPAGVAQGTAAFALTVNGTGFVNGAVVQWNGSNRTTTFVSATQLTADIGAADVAAQGVASVTVVNPAPGGGTSNALLFGVGGGTYLRVSLSSSGAEPNGPSYRPRANADGRYVVFTSDATNLSTNDSSVHSDVFLRDTCLGAPVGCVPSTTWISVRNTMLPGNSGHSDFGWVSADGRYVAFQSAGQNLVAGDTNGQTDVFLRDTCNGAPSGCTPSITLVSLSSTGAQGNSSSGLPSMTPDARYVAFWSAASNLVPGDTNNQSDIFVRDTCLNAPAGCTPSTIRASLGVGDVEANRGIANGFGPARISAEGRYVAFDSWATNLSPLDSTTHVDVYLRDTCLNAPAGCSPTTHLISVTPSGTASLANGSERPAISADGRYVSFVSPAPDLVAGDTNTLHDVFLRDTCFGGAPAGCVALTGLISVSSTGQPASGIMGSTWADISADGRYVSFHSHATNLVSGDTNSTWDIFLRDTCNGVPAGCVPAIVRLSLTIGGAEANGPSTEPAISTNGRVVVFISSATNLLPGIANNQANVFLALVPF